MNTTFTITLDNMQNGLQTLEAKYIEHVLAVNRYNQSAASRQLGISRKTLRTKLQAYFGDKYIAHKGGE